MVEPNPALSVPARDRPSRPLLRTMIGDVLRRARLVQRRTLADVARSARVSMPYLSEVERGRKEASSEILAAICDALGIGLADVLAMVGDDLARGRGRGAGVVPLDLIRGRPDRVTGFGQADGAGPEGPPAPGEARCLLVA